MSITGNSPNWLALGFANGQSSSIGTSHRFVADTVKGTAWMLVRGNATVSANSTFNGLATSPAGVSWLGDLVNADYSTQTGTLDLRIVLDTTAPTWTVRMLAKTAAAATYTVVRPLENVVDVNRPYYTSVGFALANSGPSGIIDSFSLTSSGGAADTDTDDLDDAWEILHFGNLSQGPLDDYDGDGATNRAELDAATNPADPTDLPLVSQTPISDGNPATDENGYAGSAINSVAFAQNNLITIGAQQINRILVLYADVRFPGITVVFSEPLAQDPGRNHWSRTNLTHENLGFWEATYDEKRWKQDGVLHLLYQKLPGSGASYTTQNNSTPVAVLEWNARAYFNGPIRWKVDAVTTPGQAAISAPTRAGFRYDLRTSPNLDFSAPPATIRPGNGAWQDFATWQMNEPRRFWRLERTEEATNDL